MELTQIQSRIYVVRGEKVILDFDRARLYEVETRVFNQAIKRNLENFPDD
ncbi:MAG: DNA-binding protein, partial [Flavisolibacter sp.]|nr:DNA-binding protein [Flavisolibacter sp.]